MFVGKRKVKSLLCGLLLFSTLFLYACQGNTSDVPHFEDGKLNVGASIAKEVLTRNTNDGTVTSGTFHLTYPSANNSYTVNDVIFGEDITNPQIGKVYTPDGQPFKWSLVGGGTPVFYLDNVAPTNAPGLDPMVVVFDEDNKFKAGIYDTINFTNDLLWGTKEVQRNTTGTIHFDLHHNMSRIRVMVTADNTYEFEDNLDLDGALVQITNINLNPESFNREDGTLTLGNASENYGALTLVNEAGDSSQEDFINWSSSWENENGFLTYISHSCIVPPQMLAEDNTRPRLIIKLQNGSSFSGVIPHAMEIDPPASSESTNPYPVSFSFLKEHLITIRTVISGDPPSLVFMPVKVVEWVDKGEFDFVAHQAGIYTAAEFFKMIEYYRDGNLYQLQRYGPYMKDSGIWNFNFFSTVIIQVDSLSDLYGKMNPKNSESSDYQFIFNLYSVYIQISTANPVQVDPVELHDILAGINPSPFFLKDK